MDVDRIGTRTAPQIGRFRHIGRVPAAAVAGTRPTRGQLVRSESPTELRTSSTGWKYERNPLVLQEPTVPPETMPWADRPTNRPPPLSPAWVQMFVRVSPETV